MFLFENRVDIKTRQKRSVKYPGIKDVLINNK